MNVVTIAIKSLFMGVILWLLSLAGAITFPLLPIIAGVSTGGVVSILLFFIILFFIALIGYILGKGIRTAKKPVELIILTYAGALAMGGLVGLPSLLHLPSIANTNLSWFGGTWYSIPLALLIIGTSIMLLFVVGD